MKVPFQLRWLPTSAPATALLVPGDVLRVCAELGLDPLPAMYAVADGVVVHLPRAVDRPIAGAIRLSGPSAHLLMPANAELVPALLADEASALVSKRGLVFLPGGRVLEYDPAQPIALRELVHLDAPRQRPWQALPTPPTLADDIVEMTLLDVGPSPEQILAAGGEGIGTESPTLDQGTLPTRTVGNMLFSLGQGLAKLGQSLNSKSLARLGAKLLGAGMSMVPALSQKLLGDQEAKLRELLRQFREGNIDEALRRALPLGGEPGRGSMPHPNAELPTHSLFYSLSNLLQGSGGVGSMWFTPDQTYFLLLAEYRKQAELATQRGDHRRAAFIYARLLNDYPSAARVLSQGGLHRDAAILFEKKLHDLSSAAREWEAAGEFDRALALLRKMGDHAQAGDLLRRMGEEDGAVCEYQLAAAKLLEKGGQPYDAGELLRVRAERPDLALEYYEAGWRQRPAGAALSCATRLVQHHAEGGQAEPFLAVLSEAESYLVARDAESAGNFFTEIARLAATPPLAAIADDARDRALIGIARKMIERTGTSALTNLVKNPAVWPVPLTNDARYALQEASRRPRSLTYPTIRAGTSDVTAVCQMPMSGLIFVGFASGEVVLFDSATNDIQRLITESGPILALQADPASLLILSEPMPNRASLRRLDPTIGYRRLDHHVFDAQAEAQLAIQAVNSQASSVVLWFGKEYRVFSQSKLLPMISRTLSDEEAPDMLVFGVEPGTRDLWLLALYGGQAQFLEPPLRFRHSLRWLPSMSEHSTLRALPLHVVDAGRLVITGIDAAGNVNRSELSNRDQATQQMTFRPLGNGRYLAFACVRDDLIACVYNQGIDWWQLGSRKPLQTLLTLSNPVAAFPLAEARELLIVESDGRLIRVPMIG